ncbi:MAG: VCBS repeat-containing protein [Planctomycetales bacterium]|nr:VCBS repeat-containing protein [Planctomycetales bacterium]
MAALLACGCDSAPPQVEPARSKAPAPKPPNANERDAPPAAVQPVSSALTPGHEQRRFDALLREEYARENSEVDGWQSEAFQEQATAQLKKIAKAIAHRATISAEALGELVADDFQCTTLRGNPAEVHREPGLIVAKAALADERPQHAAAAGLATALAELAEPLGDDEHTWAKLKIFGVELKDNAVATQVRYEASSRGAARAVGQVGVWRCRWSRAQPPRLQSIQAESLQESTAPNGAIFADCTQSVLGQTSAYREQLAWGVDHWRARYEKSLAPYITGLEGIAVGDLNGDTLEDVYVCQGNGLPNRLLLHQPDGTVREAAAAAGVDWLDATNSALIVDLDNDFDQDLIVGVEDEMVVHENVGRGVFRVAAAMPFGAAIDSMAAADFDGDGDMDIYLCGHTPSSPDQEESVLGFPVPFQDANNGAANRLFRNLGELKFEDVTAAVGLDVNNRRFSYAAAWEDYDNDGDLDLYVANDFGRNNLYRYTDGRFEDVAAAAGVEDVGSGMSVSWGDFNQDGHMDLYVGNMFSTAGHRVTYQRQFRPGDDAQTLAHLRRMARGNTLFANGGHGKFRDASLAADVTMGRWAWGSNFVDVNNDGRQDLLIANGFVSAPDLRDL